MKYFLVVFGVLIVGILIWTAQRNSQEQPLLRDVYTNTTLGYEFSYPIGPAGYTLKNEDESLQVQEALSLVHQQDVAQYENPPQGGEGPAVIMVRVFANPQKERPLPWAMSHIQQSNYNLLQGSTTQKVVGGANAISYMIDGLYPTEVVIVAHGERVYVFSAAYASENSPLRADFPQILSTVTFVPQANQQ